MGPSRLTAGLAGLSRLIIDSECLGTNLLLALYFAFFPKDHSFRYATPVSPCSPLFLHGRTLHTNNDRATPLVFSCMRAPASS